MIAVRQHTSRGANHRTLINHAMTKAGEVASMDEHVGERHFCRIEAVRKGRGQSPCFLKAGVSLDNDRQVILRAHDQSGVASLSPRPPLGTANEASRDRAAGQ